MAEKIFIARLDNRNYQTWKVKIEMLLISVDLWHTVSEEKPMPVTAAWSKEDQKAKALIILNVEDSQLALVKDAKSAVDVWERLKKYHEKATVTSRVSLLKKLCSFNYEEGADMEKHLFAIEELFDRLSCAGQKLESSLQVAMVYRSLPESYNGLVTALESRPDDDQTLEFVKQRLMDEYHRRMEKRDVSSERSDRALGASNEGTRRKRSRQRVCYYCRKPGHFRRDCPELREREEKVPEVKKAVKKNPGICFGVGGRRKRNGWYVDSGCSSHMTSDRKFFDKIDESVKVEVNLADGSVLRSAGVGEGFLKCVTDNGEVNEVVVKDVLYVPELDCGLLSVRKLARKGLQVNFVKSRCQIISRSGEVQAVAELCGELYALKTAECVKKSGNRRKNAAGHPIEEECCQKEQFYDCFDEGNRC